jgi:hypothetical protein
VLPPARDTNPITFLVHGGDVKKQPSISLMRRAARVADAAIEVPANLPALMAAQMQ